MPDVRGREWRDIVVIPVIDGTRLKTEYTAAIARKPLSQQGDTSRKERERERGGVRVRVSVCL